MPAATSYLQSVPDKTRWDIQWQDEMRRSMELSILFDEVVHRVWWSSPSWSCPMKLSIMFDEVVHHVQWSPPSCPVKSSIISNPSAISSKLIAEDIPWFICATIYLKRKEKRLDHISSWIEMSSIWFIAEPISKSAFFSFTYGSHEPIFVEIT